jgi:hypothetical protein
METRAIVHSGRPDKVLTTATWSPEYVFSIVGKNPNGWENSTDKSVRVWVLSQQV